jgi:hypothetical protein
MSNNNDTRSTSGAKPTGGAFPPSTNRPITAGDRTWVKLPGGASLRFASGTDVALPEGVELCYPIDANPKAFEELVIALKANTAPATPQGVVPANG